MDWQPTNPAFQHLLRAFLAKADIVYAVGGVVRDYLLAESARVEHKTGPDSKVTDLDLMVDQPALPIARAVADQLGWAFYPLDEARDVGRLVFTAASGTPLVCDIARVRGQTLEGDLLLRDFTINAMAFALDKLGRATLIDICRGRADLQAGIVRRVSAASLADDPVRLLRAVRFQVQLGFTVDEATRMQIKQICSTISLASAERIRDELWKMLETDHPDMALRTLRDVGLLPYVLPEVAQMADVAQSYPHFEDVYQHTLRVMHNAAQLRNWVLGRPPIQTSTEQTDASLGTVQPSRGSTQSAQSEDGMARWTAALTPFLIPLRRHLREPLANGRTRAEWLVWHAMLHDIGKPLSRTEEIQPDHSIRYRFYDHERQSAGMAEQRLTMLRFSKPEITLAGRVAQHHMRPHLLSSSFHGQELSRRAKYRFLRDTFAGQLHNGSQIGDAKYSDGIDVLCLAIADYQATHRHVVDDENTYLKHVQELFTYAFDANGFQQVQQSALVDGRTLMDALNLAAGRQIGELLAQLQEAQAAGEIDSKEAAIALAGTLVEQAKTTR